jgi:hypothetical protein
MKINIKFVVNFVHEISSMFIKLKSSAENNFFEQFLQTLSTVENFKNLFSFYFE